MSCQEHEAKRDSTPTHPLIPAPSLRWSTCALFALLGASACGGGESTEPTASISLAARQYLNTLIGYMQEYSINRLRIDWSAFRDSVFATAADARTIPDTYPAIRVAIELLDDGHSYFQTTTGAVLTLRKKICQPSGAAQPALPATIGYVKVNEFRGLGNEATAFANDIQRMIVAADRDDLIGWVVDVRGNGGGNMWPMVAGVGPILGEGVIGYFIDPTGAEEVWEYRNGDALLNGSVAQHVESPYRLRREQPRVAVLMDNGVASSGEALVIAFRGRNQARSFGVPTCGLSTAIAAFFMSDGALLGLTTSIMADRNKTRFGEAVPPDESVTDPAQLIDRVIGWLTTGN